MSESVVWPILGSEQEPGYDAQCAEPAEADIIPFPNSTGLFFNTVTEQELVDYIGQTTKNLGINIELGWSENFGVVFRCASFKDYDNLNDLLIEFEDAQPGAAQLAKSANSEILILTEIPEDELVYMAAGVGQDNETIEFTQTPGKDLAYQLISPQTYRAAITNRAYGIQGESVTPLTDKINKYNFAGFIKEVADNHWAQTQTS